MSDVANGVKKEFPDEEKRKRWQTETVRSTLSHSAANVSTLSSSAASVYCAMNQQQRQQHQFVGPHSPQDLYSYQRGPLHPDPYYAADVAHHQWAASTMGLSIPPIPEGVYTDMSGGGFPPTQTLLIRKRRRASSDVDYTEPSSDNDEQTSSLSTAAPPPKSRRKKRAASASKRTGKRFAWPDDLHRDFVTAIFATGLKHASPGQLADIMSMKTSAVSTEAVKSYLVKYRGKQADARNSFMSSYEAGQLAAAAGKPTSSQSDSTRQNDSTRHGSSASSTDDERTPSQTISKEQHGMLSLPKLTEDEAGSHLGASLGYLMGLLATLEQQLVAQRAATQLSSFRTAKSKSVGATMAHMHSVREHVRQVTGGAAGAATVVTAPSTVATEATNSTAEYHEQYQDHDLSSEITTHPPESPTNLRNKLMMQRHGSIDISSFDGLEHDDDDGENIFSFLNSI
ncbi:hypothetical protein MPSEU_000942400 [Mayamaea pseudoterrestris]|nr:hypothetical protein MPSEU_000942400 [Mayamaea pseudoterrestris]